jgi:acyl carrier protein
MPADLSDRVIAIIATTQKIPAETIKAESTFQELKIDSLDAINIVFALENEFNVSIPDDAAREVKTVADLTAGIAKLINKEEDARTAAG